jgi:undecaprenyl-phosphate 4-deoxy-4-formamido-L-arabinose transferase
VLVSPTPAERPAVPPGSGRENAGEPSSAAAGREPAAPDVQRLSIVVPVYQGERTLDHLLAEIEPLTRPRATRRGRPFQVAEVVLVHDGAIDNSHVVMEALAARFPFVTLVWLSRNFGQHPATLAGMAATSADWVVTIDEDGQQNPADVGSLLDAAFETGAPLVYGQALNQPAHGLVRNTLSRVAKAVSVAIVGNRQMAHFNSFRLVRGDIARSLAAYCGHGVYLDVALAWVVGRWTTGPVTLRPDRGRPSGYTIGTLLAHFGRLILTAGTRPLRLISVLGLLSILFGGGLSLVLVWARLRHQIPVRGYTSLVVVICFFSGVVLFSLGVIAEYLALTLTTGMGRPLYITVSRPPRPDRAPP